MLPCPHLPLYLPPSPPFPQTELQKQAAAAKGQAATAERSLAAATAQLATAQSELEKAQAQLSREQAEAVLHVSELQAQLQVAQDAGAAQQARQASVAAQQNSALAALQAERDRLLADQERLIEQQAELEAALAVQQAHHVSRGAPLTPPAASPAPSSVDIIRMLRDQKEALKAQHEATVEVRAAVCGLALKRDRRGGVRCAAWHHSCLHLWLPSASAALPLQPKCACSPLCESQDMKALAIQEVSMLASQLAALQRQRDNALADVSFAREEARVAAEAQERALAAARAAQHQLQEDRDAVMASLTDLQKAWVTAEAKRAVEMKRLRAEAEAKGQEADALRAALEQRAAEMRRLALKQPGGGQQTAAADKQQARSHQRYADMEGDVVLLQSMDSHIAISQGSRPASAASGEALPLQPLGLSARGNATAPPLPVAQPQQQQKAPPQQAQQRRNAERGMEQGGWGSGYLSKFSVGVA